jgi:hypothetical protein
MSPFVLISLALLASVLLGGLLAHLWEQRERRDADKKWEERERLLDRRTPVGSRHEVLRRRAHRRRHLRTRRRRTRLPG